MASHSTPNQGWEEPPVLCHASQEDGSKRFLRRHALSGSSAQSLLKEQSMIRRVAYFEENPVVPNQPYGAASRAALFWSTGIC